MIGYALLVDKRFCRQLTDRFLSDDADNNLGLQSSILIANLLARKSLQIQPNELPILRKLTWQSRQESLACK
jgi:hypothetical protein